ncbi:MAG TPA: multiheme c-type cytochrome, partial [Lacunisphaera sp.]|nr:multiheme c-type cytochrome [Lacunisphaera sp.]
MTGAFGLVLALLVGCGKQAAPPVTPPTVAQAVTQTSASCRECHQEIFQAWQDTDHALANRPVDPAGDAGALASFRPPASIGSGRPPDLVLG